MFCQSSLFIEEMSLVSSNCSLEITQRVTLFPKSPERHTTLNQDIFTVSFSPETTFFLLHHCCKPRRLQRVSISKFLLILSVNRIHKTRTQGPLQTDACIFCTVWREMIFVGSDFREFRGFLIDPRKLNPVKTNCYKNQFSENLPLLSTLLNFNEFD